VTSGSSTSGVPNSTPQSSATGQGSGVSPTAVTTSAEHPEGTGGVFASLNPMNWMSGGSPTGADAPGPTNQANV
jgi:hypothetical protein